MYGFIYVTTNNVTGMKYIGQKTYDKNGLWKNYLGSGLYLKRAIKKYGKNNFSRTILEECKSKELLDEREIYWIKHFDAVNSNNYYNISSGGDGGNTIAGFSKKRLHELSLLHSKKLLESYKIGSRSMNNKLTKEEVLNIIIPRLKNNEFNSDIANDLNVSSGTIDDIRNHRTWKDLTKDIKFDNISDRKRSRKPKTVSQYSIDGIKLKTFNSAFDAGKYIGKDSKQIMDVCSGNKKSAFGYVWRYDEDDFNKYDSKSNAEVKVNQYTKSGKYIRTYNSIKEASNKTQINRNSISAALHGRSKSAGGFLWSIND